jgi:hypothetical protein
MHLRDRRRRDRLGGELGEDGIERPAEALLDDRAYRRERNGGT